ncbi:hypothetical protein [Williamsia sp. 1135]|jgi:predicted transcriptional regulator|uniref:hypothetical protein n=1 Tax=Williamsia sp. 1135 TaxID=1889262 RepID=UPI000A11ADBA|nr:hypothetical protein [Williamsia sp. 1135]ORM37792.1 hypothetical protein BFL43_03045 [Williamsia sp. 1135]
MNPHTVAGVDLEVGKLAQDLREQGQSWTAIAADLEESPSYLQRAVSAYLAHTDAAARADQLPLF